MAQPTIGQPTESITVKDLCAVIDFIVAAGQSIEKKTIVVPDEASRYTWNAEKAKQLKLRLPNPQLDALARPALTPYEWWQLVGTLDNAVRREVISTFKTIIVNPSEARVNIREIVPRITFASFGTKTPGVTMTTTRLRDFLTLLLLQVSCKKILPEYLRTV